MFFHLKLFLAWSDEYLKWKIWIYWFFSHRDPISTSKSGIFEISILNTAPIELEIFDVPFQNHAFFHLRPFLAYLDKYLKWEKYFFRFFLTFFDDLRFFWTKN